MSLRVTARALEGAGGDSDFDASAGFESWRKSVWGSGAVRALGLHILPSLATTDVRVSGQELAALEGEVNVLRAGLRGVVDALLEQGVQVVSNGDPYATVLARLENIGEAVRRAREMANGGGEVVID